MKGENGVVEGFYNSVSNNNKLSIVESAPLYKCGTIHQDLPGSLIQERSIIIFIGLFS